MLHKGVVGRPPPIWRCTNICKGVKREVHGELPNRMTFICSYHSVIDNCWVGWWVTPQKASRKVKHIFFMKWSAVSFMLCPAVCLYWAFFTSAPCALLRFIEERALSWERKARASDRKDSPSRERLKNGEIISERRTNDDPKGEEGVGGVSFLWRSRKK